VDKADVGSIRNKISVAKSMGFNLDVDEESNDIGESSVFKSLQEVLTALSSISSDGHLASLVSESNPSGYTVYKSAANGVATLHEVASFATNEMMVHDVGMFIEAAYNLWTDRERQVRYEVHLKDMRISKLFALRRARTVFG
jgi:hypothetical protein